MSAVESDTARAGAGRVGPIAILVLVVIVAGVFSYLRFGHGEAPPASPEPAAEGAGQGEVAQIMSEAARLHDGNDHERSAAAYARAAALALERGDLDAHFTARAQRGVCLKMLGRTEESRGELLPALEYAREHGKRTMEGLALGNLARCASIDDDMTTALDWEDQLATLLAEQAPTRELVLTLEQAGMVALGLGDVDGAIERLRRALEFNGALASDDDQSGNLTRELAWALSRKGDDEGSAALWDGVETSAAGLARQALQLADLGRHDVAAQMAWEAAHLFEQDAPDRRDDRDDALVLALGELVRAGQLPLCRERLTALLAKDSDPAAEAPFRLVEGRLELADGRPAEAVIALQRALDGFGDDARAAWAGWLLAVAHIQAARPDLALEVLDAQPDSLPSTLVRGLYWSVEPPPDRLASELLPLLAQAPDDAAGRDLDLLRKLCPVPLPDPAFLALHLQLQDADRLRGAGREALAEAAVRDGVVHALLWTAREQRRGIGGRWPSSADEAALEARLRAWTRGDLDEREAVAAVVPGPRESYLVLCTRALGATTFGLAPGAVLHEKALAAAESLRQNDLGRVLDASLTLGQALFGGRALVDLEHVDELLCVFPDAISSVPPAMLVLEAPSPAEPLPFLVRRRTAQLASLLALDDGVPPAGGVLRRIGAPTIDLSRSHLALPEIASRYGGAALQPGELRERDEAVPGEVVTTLGAEATSRVLRALGDARALELALPGFGGDHFGGLALAPDDGAPYGDERAGFLPWTRLLDCALPPLCVLDRTRFDPGDAEHGALTAADALVLAGAREVLLTRWPLPAEMRDRVTAAVLDVPEGARHGLLGDAARRLADVQRAWLDAAFAAKDASALHPRHWAAWLAFGTPRSLP